MRFGLISDQRGDIAVAVSVYTVQRDFWRVPVSDRLVCVGGSRKICGVIRCLGSKNANAILTLTVKS